MRAFRNVAAAAGCGLLFLTSPALAAWNNVFQACCNNCRSAPSASFYAPVTACAPPCPPPMVPQTSYVQRSYYQPVVSYRTTTYYEPVTRYQTSYYYEPVVSYRSSCYVDPCTGCPRQVTTPVTSYRLRSQCNAVQSYVQRNALTPVTSYRQAFYYEAVTTMVPACPPPCPTPCSTPAPPAATEGPGSTIPPVNVPPAAAELPTAPKSTDGTTIPAIPGGTSRQFVPPTKPVAPARIASNPRPSSGFRGEVLYRDGVTPRAGVQLRFVSLQRPAEQQVATADAVGQFAVALAAGRYQLYMQGPDGKPVYHSQVEVKGPDLKQVVVVSR